jgi:undecaprenyl-diphosphatase
VTERHTPRLRLVLGGVTAVLLVVTMGSLLAMRDAEPRIDAEWMEEIVEHRSPFWDVPAMVFDVIGGGWFAILLVPLGAALAFALARRPWSAIAFVVASAASSLLVQALKRILGRVRPEDVLLPLDSPAFPSGHVANAATIAVILALLLRRAWIWAAGAAYVLLMALSRTYLGAHWITDTVGGALLGAAIAVLVWTLFAPRLRTEHPN